MEQFLLNAAELTAAEKKELTQALKYTKKVNEVRGLLCTGPIGAAIGTVAVFSIFMALGVLFFPFLIIAPFAAVFVPVNILRSNARWRQLLPASEDGKEVVLSYTVKN